MVAKKKRKQALPFQRGNMFLADPEDIYLETRPGHKHYDSRSLLPPDEREVKYMTKHGVVLPIVVEKCGDLAVAVDGRRRVVNAREANRQLKEAGGTLIRVKVIVKQGDALNLFETMIVTNEHRREVDAVGQALLMQEYLERGKTEEEAAELWGVTTKTIQNRIKLLSLCEEARQALAAGTLTLTRALRLANLSHDEQRQALKKKPKKDKIRRPSKVKVERVLAPERLPDQVRAAIRWATGQITDEEAAEEIEGFEEVLNVEEALATA